MFGISNVYAFFVHNRKENYPKLKETNKDACSHFVDIISGKEEFSKSLPPEGPLPLFPCPSYATETLNICTK